MSQNHFLIRYRYNKSELVQFVKMKNVLSDEGFLF